jgi:hypothetical protein
MRREEKGTKEGSENEEDKILMMRITYKLHIRHTTIHSHNKR